MCRENYREALQGAGDFAAFISTATAAFRLVAETVTVPVGIAAADDDPAFRRLSSFYIGWGPPMTIRGHSSFEPRQLVLFGVAAIVLLVFTWTYVH